MAVDQVLIIGAFVATEWLAATTQNFPGTAADRVGRWGFVDHETPETIASFWRKISGGNRLLVWL